MRYLIFAWNDAEQIRAPLDALADIAHTRESAVAAAEREWRRGDEACYLDVETGLVAYPHRKDDDRAKRPDWMTGGTSLFALWDSATR